MHENFAKEKNYDQFLHSFELVNQIVGSSDDNPELLTIESIHKCYLNGTKTPLDIAKQTISNAKKLSHLNIFIQFNDKDILFQAEASTLRWKENKQLSILDGIPVAVKDQFNVFNSFNTKGTSFCGEKYGKTNDYKSESLIIKRLRKLGAILVGKTHLHEIGIQPNGYNPYYGTCKNAYSVNCCHDTGGSSSGSAVAVSSQLVPLAIGADAGGSIRTPSAMNGVVGLKGTYGRVPFTPNEKTSCWSVVHFGCIGNTVKDEIIGYMAISGAVTDDEMNDYKKNDENDDENDGGRRYKCNYKGWNGWKSVVFNYMKDPPRHLHLVNKMDGFSTGVEEEKDSISNGINNSNSKIRIGIYRDWYNDSQKSIVSECDKIVNILSNEYNIEFEDIEIPYLGILSKAHAINTLSEWITTDAKTVDYEYKLSNKNWRYCDSTQIMLRFAKNYKNTDLVSAQIVKTYILDYLENEIFNGPKKVDIILTPSCAIVAEKYHNYSKKNSQFLDVFDSGLVSNLMRFAHFANFTGIPAISIPIGYTNVDGNGDIMKDGTQLPVSMQLMANHWNEHLLFRIANLIETKIVKRQLPPQSNRAVYKLD